MLPLLRADLLISVHSETPCMTKAYFIQALGRTSGSLIFGCQFIFVHIGKFEQEKMSMYLLKFYSKKDPIKIDIGIFQKFIPCYIWTPSTYLCLNNVSGFCFLRLMTLYYHGDKGITVKNFFCLPEYLAGLLESSVYLRMKFWCLPTFQN